MLCAYMKIGLSYGTYCANETWKWCGQPKANYLNVKLT